MSNKNIVVLGCGYWGKNIIRNFYELDYLYGVADIDSSISNNFSELYKVKDLQLKKHLITMRLMQLQYALQQKHI